MSETKLKIKIEVCRPHFKLINQKDWIICSWDKEYWFSCNACCLGNKDRFATV